MDKTLLESQEGVLYFTSLALSMFPLYQALHCTQSKILKHCNGFWAHCIYPQSQPIGAVQCHSFETHMCKGSFPQCSDQWCQHCGWYLLAKLLSGQHQSWAISNKLETCKITGISNQPCARHINVTRKGVVVLLCATTKQDKSKGELSRCVTISTGRR